MKGELSEIISKISVQCEKINIFQQFSPFWAYVKFSSVFRTQKGLYQIFSNLSFCNKWICWWWNPLKDVLEQTFLPIAPSGHLCLSIYQPFNSKLFEKSPDHLSSWFPPALPLHVSCSLDLWPWRHLWLWWTWKCIFHPQWSCKSRMQLLEPIQVKG